VLAPDEIFFPTLVQHDARLRATATCDGTLHYSHWIRPGPSWHPEYLDMRHLGILLAGRAEGQGSGDVLYFRKVQPLRDAIPCVLVALVM
jgi:hypothetical protein